jgi:hypothetical protein
MHNGDALGGEHGRDQPCARRIVLDDEERDVGERLDTVRLKLTDCAPCSTEILFPSDVA